MSAIITTRRLVMAGSIVAGMTAFAAAQQSTLRPAVREAARPLPPVVARRRRTFEC